MTTMTFVPSIVAPMAMPTRAMTMPMPVPNFMTAAPWGARSRRGGLGVEGHDAAVAGGAAHERERAWCGAARASSRPSTDARQARTAVGDLLRGLHDQQPRTPW